MVPVKPSENVRSSQHFPPQDQSQQMLAIMPASIGQTQSRKSQELAISRPPSHPETLARETEEAHVPQEMDRFRVSNLKKPAAIVPVAQQDEEEEFDDIPFTTKLSVKNKIQHRQPMPVRQEQLQNTR